MPKADLTHNYTGTVNNPPGAPDFKLSKAKVTYACWNHEIGKKGTEHFQYYIHFKDAVSKNAARKNVALIFGKKAHIKPCRSAERSMHYCSKPCADPQCEAKGCKEVRAGESQVLEKFEYGTKPTQGSRTDLRINEFTTAINMAREGRVDEAEEHLIQKRPMQWMGNSDKYRKALEYVAPRQSEKRYKMEDYNTAPVDLTTAALITGPTGCGKTGFALAHFDNPVFISDIDDLKRFNLSKYDGIVFDDCSFCHWPPESVIKLLDMDYSRSIRLRYTNVSIPKGMKRIFTHNEEKIFYDPLKTPASQQAAIDRRVSVFKVGSDLRLNA